MKQQGKSGWRRWRKASKRTNRDWHIATRRNLDRADYWSGIPLLTFVRRKSEGRNPRFDSWFVRQPFTGRLGWLGQIVCHRPGVNATVSL